MAPVITILNASWRRAETGSRIELEEARSRTFNGGGGIRIATSAGAGDGTIDIVTEVLTSVIEVPTTVVTDIDGQLTTFTSTSLSTFTRTTTKFKTSVPTSIVAEINGQPDNTPLIAGITSSVCILLVAILTVCYCLCIRRRRRRLQHTPSLSDEQFVVSPFTKLKTDYAASTASSSVDDGVEPVHHRQERLDVSFTKFKTDYAASTAGAASSSSADHEAEPVHYRQESLDVRVSTESHRERHLESRDLGPGMTHPTVNEESNGTRNEFGPTVSAPEQTSQLFQMFMQWLTTHYHQSGSGSQPPSYPGSMRSNSVWSDARR